MESIHAGLQRTFNQTHSFSQEFSSVDNKVEFLNNDRVAKVLVIDEFRQAHR